MMAEHLTVPVTFDAARGCYVTVSDQLPPVAALSLSMLRKRVAAALLPDDVEVILQLDRRARTERDQRRRGGHGGAEQWRG
jgi:hypothetical protein